MINRFIVFLIFVNFILLYSCEPRLANRPVTDDNSLGGSGEEGKFISFRKIDLYKNKELKEALQKYFDSLRRPSYGRQVYQLVLEPRGFETKFRITSIALYSEFLSNVPSGYLDLGDKIILIYTGLEGITPMDSIFFKKLDSLVRDRLIKDVDQKGQQIDTIHIPMWHPTAWEFRLIYKDSIVINPNVKSPNTIRESAPPTLPPRLRN